MSTPSRSPRRRRQLIVGWMMMILWWLTPWCCQLSAAQNNNNNDDSLILTRELLNMLILSGKIDRDPSMYTFLARFEAEPDGDNYPIDAAILVRGNDGRCYVRFRGALGANSLDAFFNGGMQEMYQQFEPGVKEVCRSPNVTNPTTQCCTVGTGMYKAYYATYVKELEAAVRDCVSTTCGSNVTNATHDTDDCLVLMGVSQGAMIAQVATVALRDLNPITLMYGPHATLYPDCQVVDPNRMYRMVNSGYCRLLFANIFLYDFPYLVKSRGEVHYGHMLIFSDDTTGIAYMGVNTQNWEVPWLWRIMGLSAHPMVRGVEWWSASCPIKGYMQRMEDLIATYDDTTRVPRLQYPIRSTGFATGNRCTRLEECQSKHCVRYRPKAILPVPGKCQ